MKLGLTASQLSLWVGQKLNPDIPLYNTAAYYDIAGPVNEMTFVEAFQLLINATDALRLQIFEENGVPYQSATASLEYKLEVIDFSSNATDSELIEWLLKRSRQKLDISKRVFDTALLRINEDRFIWFLNLHHLVTDGFSRKLIFSKMAMYYASIDNGNEISDLLESSPYMEYVKAELEHPSGADSEASYWEKKIESVKGLPALYGQQAKNITTASTRITVPLGRDKYEKLLHIAENSSFRSFSLQLTLFNIFAAMLMAYLYKVSGQNKQVIGTTNHNRSNRKFRKTVGHFVKVFPLAVELQEEDTLSSLVNQLSLENNEQLKHGINGLVSPELNRSYNVIFNYIQSDFSNFANFPTKTAWLHTGHIDTQHYFQCHITDFEASGNYNLHFDLNNDVFPKAFQPNIPSHFIQVIDAFIDDQDCKLSDINITTTSEIKQIAAWNNTISHFDPSESLLTKFELQVQQTPDTTALVFGKEQYTYKQLNEQANRVGHFLLQSGIKANDIVAVSLDRSIDMMVYIYGILKAGAAYLPLDTNLPSERLRFIAEDAQFKIVFYNHQGILTDQLPKVACLHVAEMETHLQSFPLTSPEVITEPDHLAYVIYTSGSTGEPKGVKCHHKGIVNRLNWMNRDYPIDAEDRFIQKTPITFDVSLWELFWPLQEGAKLIIERPDGHKDPEQLVNTINEHQVTVIHFVPSMLNVFIKHPRIENCTSIKRIFCSGEALAVNTVKQTHGALKGVEIYNLYGPTEASVDVTSWHCSREDLDAPIPIGFPVANTQIYILDNQLNAVPIGVKGELFIGGVQVALGYLNREQLTQTKFLDDPFVKIPGARMYKTGDVARYRSDGAIEYLGRTDSQIKLRGIRIELGEIENIIIQKCPVSEVAVIVDSMEMLVAYYTSKQSDTFSFNNELKKWLPDYMVPTHFIHLHELPLSKNGKVDKKALQALEVEHKEVAENRIAPEGEIEELLAQIWKEVLGLEQVGANENFISLGGHSLAAIRVTTRINEEIEINFPLSKIFELPTIKEYAQFIEETLIKLLD